MLFSCHLASMSSFPLWFLSSFTRPLGLISMLFIVFFVFSLQASIKPRFSKFSPLSPFSCVSRTSFQASLSPSTKVVFDFPSWVLFFVVYLSHRHPTILHHMQCPFSPSIFNHMALIFILWFFFPFSKNNSDFLFWHLTFELDNPTRILKIGLNWMLCSGHSSSQPDF